MCGGSVVCVYYKPRCQIHTSAPPTPNPPAPSLALLVLLLVLLVLLVLLLLLVLLVLLLLLLLLQVLCCVVLCCVVVPNLAFCACMSGIHRIFRDCLSRDISALKMVWLRAARVQTGARAE